MSAARPDPQSAVPTGDAPRDFLDGRSLLLSLGLHLAALVLVLWVLPALRPEPAIYQTVQLNIVSAPRAASPEPPPEEPPAPEEELIVETPEDPAPPEDDPAPVPEPEPEREPEPEPEPAETPPPEPPDSTPAEPVPAPDPPEEESEARGEDIVVRTEGIRRDHPAYWENIVLQMRRCLRLPPSLRAEGLSAAIDFVIQADGSVTDVAVAASSGSFRFDNEAMTAAEDCVDGRLGPLPESYQYDVMPIRFLVRPERGGAEGAAAGEDGQGAPAELRREGAAGGVDGEGMRGTETENAAGCSQ